MSYKTRDKIIAKFPKSDDLEIHLKMTTIIIDKRDLATFVDLREYVPSTKKYGKGLVLGPELARQIGEELCAL